MTASSAANQDVLSAEQELVKILRASLDAATTLGDVYAQVHRVDLGRTIETITSLRAENQRLRKALEAIGQGFAADWLREHGLTVNTYVPGTGAANSAQWANCRKVAIEALSTSQDKGDAA